MEKQANPTYLIEHFGEITRLTVTHAFNATERITFTVEAPSGPETMKDLHAAAFGRLRALLGYLP